MGLLPNEDLEVWTPIFGGTITQNWRNRAWTNVSRRIGKVFQSRFRGFEMYKDGCSVTSFVFQRWRWVGKWSDFGSDSRDSGSLIGSPSGEEKNFNQDYHRGAKELSSGKELLSGEESLSVEEKNSNQDNFLIFVLDII